MRARLDDPRLVHVSADYRTLSKSKRGTVGGVDSQDQVRVSCQVPETMRRKHHCLASSERAQPVEQVCTFSGEYDTEQISTQHKLTIFGRRIECSAGFVEQ